MTLASLLAREVRRWNTCVAAFAHGRAGPDAVHELRVSTRRCQEALRLLGTPLPSLASLNPYLGKARDVEMLWQRLRSSSTSSSQHKHLLEILNVHRLNFHQKIRLRFRRRTFARLARAMQSIGQARSQGPAKDRSAARAALERAWQDLDRLLRQRPKAKKKSLMHPLRRAIRRLRYRADLLIPFGGPPLKRLALEAALWQGYLGRHQDARASRKLLKDLAKKQSRSLRKEMRAAQHETARRFWKAWRLRGHKTLEQRSARALKTLHASF